MATYLQYSVKFSYILKYNSKTIPSIFIKKKTLTDIHGNIVLVNVAELHIYVSWKFHEDSSNSL